MEKIQFDSGMRQYRINGNSVLRFNPGDPNVYARFIESEEKIRQVEAELAQKAKELSGEESGESVVKLMAQADGKMKEILGWIFGPWNDFNAILDGVNLLAVATNGQRVVTNLFSALEPILMEGAKQCAGEIKTAAVKKAKDRRATQ